MPGQQKSPQSQHIQRTERPTAAQTQSFGCPTNKLLNNLWCGLLRENALNLDALHLHALNMNARNALRPHRIALHQTTTTTITTRTDEDALQLLNNLHAKLLQKKSMKPNALEVAQHPTQRISVVHDIDVSSGCNPDFVAPRSLVGCLHI
jgi:hypothetical protein